MKKLIPIIIVCFLILFGFSCIKTNPAGGTAIKAMTNEWWVTVSEGGVDQIGTRVRYATYNTNTNSTDSMWVDDLENFWQTKFKVQINLQALTFSTNNAQNDYYDSHVTVSNGKILPNAGHSKTGIIADSIYFEIKFDDDTAGGAAPRTFVVSGVERTFRAEDDY